MGNWGYSITVLIGVITPVISIVGGSPCISKMFFLYTQQVFSFGAREEITSLLGSHDGGFWAPKSARAKVSFCWES